MDDETELDPHITGAVSVTNLTDDCLFVIFKKLKHYGDRNAFGLTCHRWLQIQNSACSSLTLQFYYNPRVYQQYASYLPRLLSRFPQLRSVSLAGPELLDTALTQLRDSGSTLRSLSLYCCLGMTDNGLSLISNGCPYLVTITLYRCNITDAGLECLASSCSYLENVNLSYCMLVTDRGINALSRDCLKIHVLMISYCRSITGSGFRGCSPTLAYLEADSCLLTPEGLLAVASGGGLEYLNVSSLRSWAGVDELYSIGAGFSTRLRFLNLRMCRFVGDKSVAAIAKGCPLLEEWSLAVCHEVRISGWKAVGSSCGRLKVLHVNRCRNMCDQGLQALRDGCGLLKVLYMHGCRRVTSLGLETFKLLRPVVEVKREESVSIGPCLDVFFTGD